MGHAPRSFRPAPAGGVRERAAVAEPEGGRLGEVRVAEWSGEAQAVVRAGEPASIGLFLSGLFPAAAAVSRTVSQRGPAGAGGSAAEAPSPLAQPGLSSCGRP